MLSEGLMQNHSGTTFLEILISLFILSSILLGLDALQLTAWQKTKAEYYLSIASEQLISMSERIYASSENEIDTQFHRWNQQNQFLLPHGTGSISGTYPTYTITINWGVINEHDCNKPTTGTSGCLSITVSK